MSRRGGRGDGGRTRNAPKEDKRPSPSKGDRPRVDWLSRALARAGVMSLKDAEHAIRAGRVSVFGRVVRQPIAMVQPGDEVKVDGHPIALRRETIVLMFHKPAGFVTTNAERERDKSVFGLLDAALPDELRGYGWHAVGRLDKGTTGLLLFTNDERFVEHATAPTVNLPKRYAATVQGDPRQGELELLRQGMELDDGPTKPALARVRAKGVVELTLTEGRNHQAKRMLGAIGFPVLALHREAIGTLELDVGEGEVRVLSDEEVEGALAYRRG